MRSESCTFIWQPCVSMKYFTFRFRLSLSLLASPFAPVRRARNISPALARTAVDTTFPAIIRASSSSRSADTEPSH